MHKIMETKMNDKIKSIFSKDLADALKRAREDERAKCTHEMNVALEKQRQKIEGEFILRLHEKDAEITSMNLRLKNIDDREKKVNERIQTVREMEILQRRIASDLVYIQTERRNENILYTQKHTSLLEEIQTVERKMIGII